jgi:hypothetical protein
MNNVVTPSGPVPPHRPCEALAREGLDDDAVHRFILGSDEHPIKLSRQEATQQLGDRFAQLVLLKGVFPHTAGEVLNEIEQAVPRGDPLRTRQFFLVGEGTQIAPIPGVAVNRSLRFLATVGKGPGGPDIMLSAPGPDRGTVELMAWDLAVGGFNYYRTVGASSAWVFAGNSRHALTAPTRDNGPFESHKNGHFLMKELKSPWVHWESPAAHIDAQLLNEEPLRSHPWVAKLEPGGAYTLEDNVAKPAIQRWTKARLEALVSGDSEETPRRVLEQVLTTLTVNLVSSKTSSAAAVSGAVSGEEPRVVDLPETFFVDSDALSGVLGLAPPPPPFVDSSVYAESLRTFDVRLTDRRAAFERPGDTHFAFVVPERAFEDKETLREAIERGIVSRRLAACLLMVDFPNPIFSKKRQRLLDLKYVPDIAFGETDDFSQSVTDAIRSSDTAAQPGTAEHEFAQLWDAGEDFEATFNALLQDYYTAFAERLRTQEGFDNYLRLAESRRDFVRGGDFVRGMPIAESDLLFSRTNIPSRERIMLADGTVEEV